MRRLDQRFGVCNEEEAKAALDAFRLQPGEDLRKYAEDVRSLTQSARPGGPQTDKEATGAAAPKTLCPEFVPQPWTPEGWRGLWNGDGDHRRSFGQLNHRPRNWQRGPGESGGLRCATWWERPRQEFSAAGGDWAAFQRRFLTHQEMAGWTEEEALRALVAAEDDDALTALVTIPWAVRSTLHLVLQCLSEIYGPPSDIRHRFAARRKGKMKSPLAFRSALLALAKAAFLRMDWEAIDALVLDKLLHWHESFALSSKPWMTGACAPCAPRGAFTRICYFNEILALRPA
ncbi:unnamed protein product [Lampetra fluviatilis]